MDDFTIKVLDHGFVTLRNVSGPTRRTTDVSANGYIRDRAFDADDIDPANSARMSFDMMDSGRTRDQDLKLANYLMKNKHTTPFEMIECWIEMKMPIFVARQFVRHRTVSINEVSARYVQLPADWYIPETVGGKPINAKQGQSDTLSEDDQIWFKTSLDDACAFDYGRYDEAIKRGVAAEHARLFLHVNHYTHWLWKQDLHNLMNFMSLRDHSHAQIESQKYGQAVDKLIRQVLPATMELYDQFRRLPG